MLKTENQKKLLKILNEIFQLDQSDLDFGIYRIMNSKSKEINEFLDNDLLSSVSSAFSSNDNNSTQKELDEAIQQAQSLGADPETLPKVIALREQLSSTTTSSNLENDVFSHLANFFKRYYKDGDFVSLRRYKKDTYAIPYEGEEVKLHWANSDQYYIKSGEYFRDYTFTVNDKTIHLKLSDAETESNNNKATSDKERRFVILESNPCEVINDELYINFEYKAIGKENQDKLNEKAVAKALESIKDLDFIAALNDLAPTEKNKKRTIFEKHLKSYTSRNSFDYFIHKDLGGFLGRELDFYIKNEILFLDDVMDSPIKYEEVMGKIKIFKEVSQKVIAFLTQLEELQKKLWEKKKFIIETNYCITLDKIDEDYYEQILDCDEQKAEWKELFNVDVQSVNDLKEEKYLVLDTKFFDKKFKYKLLSEFDNLDEDIDGVLINSENFGALTLLQDRYKEQIQTVYIDPPYNTNASEIIYMNGYKHSSWLSLLENRLSLSHSYLKNDGIIEVAIDDEEQRFLHLLLDNSYGATNFISNLAIQHNPKGRDQEHIASSHEYLIMYAKNKQLASTNSFTIKGKDFETKYPVVDENGRYRELPLKRTGSDSLRTDRPYMFFPFLINKSNNELSIITDDEYKEIYNSSTKEFNDNYVSSLKTRYEDEGYYFILPKNDKGGLLRWRWGFGTCKEAIINKELIVKSNTVYNKDRSNDKVKPKSLWYGEKYDASSKGTNLLKNFFNEKRFDYPKSLYAVMDALIIGANKNSSILDFFAGSGTTGHSVINLNREDNGNRKYILVEMGEYFNTATKPRIQKVIYSDIWKEGKPTTKNGVSQIFKYFKLESYEDALNNLEFKKTEEQQKTLEFHPEAKEDYMINYSLDVESQGSLLNIDTFSTPFDYKLKIATSSVGETKDTAIDLVETFNYLLGLVVKRIELLKGYLVVEGRNLKKEKILIIWRDGQSSEELNEFFKKMDWSVYDREFDTIYVNGDNNLDNLRKDEDHYKVKLIEQEFKSLMFGN
jgi:adenine-specific DNA-methyltransferase